MIINSIYIRANLKIFILTVTACLILTSCNKEENNVPESTKRFFRFKSCPENSHGNWQDTSFIAATSNPIVIQQCLEQLNLPMASRKLFPLGKIETNFFGYNKNGTHLFNWQYVEDAWGMVELGIEIYDGCAYSDVELTNYVESVGSYGGWSNIILEEIINP